MAVNEGTLTIPKFSDLAESTKEAIVDSFNDLKDSLSTTDKKQIEAYKKNKEQQDKIVKAQETLVDILKVPQGIRKMQDKLTQSWHKWIVKKDFLKTVGSMLKKLVDKAGSWLMDLLKMLFFLAIFDPQGKFLASILNFITNMVVMFINIIIARLPGLLKTMWNLFWNVLVPGIAKMGRAIGETIFGKGTVLADIFEMIGGFLPVGVLILGTLSKIMSVGSAVWGVLGPIITTLFPSLIPMFAALKVAVLGFLASLGPILLIIGAIAVAFFVFWKWGDRILKWLDAIPQWLEKKFGFVGEIMGDFFSAITAPLKFIVWAVQVIKNEGFKPLLKKVWKAMVNFFKEIGKAMKYMFNQTIKDIGGWFGSVFRSITDTVSDTFISIANFLVVLPFKLKDLFMDMLMGLSDYVSVLFSAEGVKALATGDFDRFGALATATGLKRKTEEAGTMKHLAKGEVGEIATKIQQGTISKKDLQRLEDKIEEKREKSYPIAIKTLETNREARSGG